MADHRPRRANNLEIDALGDAAAGEAAALTSSSPVFMGRVAPWGTEWALTACTDEDLKLEDFKPVLLPAEYCSADMREFMRRISFRSSSTWGDRV